MGATITFKAKAHPAGDEYRIIHVPTLKRDHCDMDAFRTHARWGGLVNSTLFPNVLSRIKRDIAPAGILRTDRLPGNVTVDESGFLAVVTIAVS